MTRAQGNKATTWRGDETTRKIHHKTNTLYLCILDKKNIRKEKNGYLDVTGTAADILLLQSKCHVHHFIYLNIQAYLVSFFILLGRNIKIKECEIIKKGVKV